MIGFLKGKIIKKLEKAVILDTGNVGYILFLNKNTISKDLENKEIEFFIHSHIREDAFDLYGFLTYEELEMFKTLLGINGIGPKIALEILNTDPNKIREAILSENVDFILKTPGIGQKKAKRIILELIGKLPKDDLRTHSNLKNSVHEDILMALEKMGYSKNEILKTLDNMPKDITDEKDIIKFFLQNC